MASVILHELSEETAARLRSVYGSFKNGQSFARTQPGNVIIPSAYEKFKDAFKNWEARPDDVYVLGFPRSGTTWTRELVWLIENDCNFKGAKDASIDVRVPCMEAGAVTDFMREWGHPSIQVDAIKAMKSISHQRLLQSHLHSCLLPADLLDKSKVVLCLRNPKDTVVSCYHLDKILKMYDFTSDFETYFDLFMDNLIPYSSYFDYAKELWARRNHPNVCLLFYEEMKKDLATNVRKLANFLGKELTNENMDALVNHLSFREMKNNKAVNRKGKAAKHFFNEGGDFIRKGKVGDWKNYLTEKMNKRMDEAIEKYLKPIGLEFQYE